MVASGRKLPPHHSRYARRSFHNAGGGRRSHWLGCRRNLNSSPTVRRAGSRMTAAMPATKPWSEMADDRPSPMARWSTGQVRAGERLKVLDVIPSVSDRDGGPSRAIREFERALADRGIEVTTVTTNHDADGRTLPVLCGQPVATPSATRWYFPRTTVVFKTSAGMARWLGDNIDAFDIVHAHGLFSFAPVTAAYLARRAGVPYVLRPLGVLARYGMTRRRPVLKKVSLALIERRLIESASAVHFTSAAERAEAEALGLNCRSVVIPLGIDP